MKSTNLLFRKIIVCFVAAFLFICNNSFAWGPKGHALVAQIAYRYLSESTKKNVQQYLSGVGIDSASNWMDAMRSDYRYDFMKPWHYINFEKGTSFTPSMEENIVTRLTFTFNELKHRPLLCSEQVKFDLLLLFHLMGDLHQPIHAGYLEDKGGNTKQVEFLGVKTNLHHIWDENIIDSMDIDLGSCLKHSSEITPDQLQKIKAVNFIDWMNESRSYLDSVYDFTGFMLGRDYAQKNTGLIERRLLYAGIRLSAVLEKTFADTVATINGDEIALKSKNGVNINDAMKYVGKKVTICARVYGVKTTDKVTFLNLGARFPNAPLTVVIFAKDRANFKATIEELYNDRNVCVTGKIVEYQGKSEIIVSKQEEIEVK